MKYLLIPSAILIPEEMRAQFGKIPSALFPLGSSTILEFIVQKYQQDVEEIFIVVQQKRELIEDYIRWKKLPIHIVTTNGHSLSDTIADGIRAIRNAHSDAAEVIINFGDTYLSDISTLDLKKDTICYAMNPVTSQWTFFEASEGLITSIMDKRPVAATEEPAVGQAIVGVFSISDCAELMRCIQVAQSERRTEIDCFYKALIHYSAVHSFSFVRTHRWIDTGHSENYYKAKTGVEARAFNSIEINENKGTLTKRSYNVEKFLGEINWYLKMPGALQYLLPRIYDYSLERSNPYVEMEYYGYHTLHEMLIFSDLPLIKWHQLFERLKFVVNDMERFTVSASDDTLMQAMRDIYMTKTVSRLEGLRNQPAFSHFFSEPIIVNGECYPSLTEIIRDLPAQLQSIVLDSFDGRFTIIHGDLCFANILVEDKYSYMRMIDPRGKFGKFDIYGDPRYDLAKLLHSIEGNYDYIIEDMFELNRDGNRITYSVPEKSGHIFKIFREVFGEQLEDIRAIRMIEATLFLSMIPLHSDHLERQYAMLATGLKLWKDVTQQ